MCKTDVKVGGIGSLLFPNGDVSADLSVTGPSRTSNSLGVPVSGTILVCFSSSSLLYVADIECTETDIKCTETIIRFLHYLLKTSFIKCSNKGNL